MSQRVLIAGIGNIFLQDDGFGVEVVRRLAAESLPEWVRVADFGIRGVHLAYEMLDGDYDAAILVDAGARPWAGPELVGARPIHGGHGYDRSPLR